MKGKVPSIDGIFEIPGNLFIAEKNRMGYSYWSEVYLLREFSRFASGHSEYADKDVFVTKKMVEAWLQSKWGKSSKSIHSCAVVIRQFAAFLVRSGGKAYVLPFGYLPKVSSGFAPHIFTEQQLLSIFSAADELKPTGVSPYRHLTIPLMLRLIYGCGLRVSEATHLKTEDVDLEEGILIIRNSKFGKSRSIPMAESLRLRCGEYFRTVHKQPEPGDIFFPNTWRAEYLPQSISGNFRSLLRKCGIPRTDYGPRLHDFRHSHAVHTLKRWSESGEDMNALLPVLSAYLGHNGLSGTQIYLRLTADLYPHIISKVESAYGDIFPKEGCEL